MSAASIHYHVLSQERCTLRMGKSDQDIVDATMKAYTSVITPRRKVVLGSSFVLGSSVCGGCCVALATSGFKCNAVVIVCSGSSDAWNHQLFAGLLRQAQPVAHVHLDRHTYIYTYVHTYIRSYIHNMWSHNIARKQAGRQAGR